MDGYWCFTRLLRWFAKHRALSSHSGCRWRTSWPSPILIPRRWKLILTVRERLQSSESHCYGWYWGGFRGEWALAPPNAWIPSPYLFSVKRGLCVQDQLTFFAQRTFIQSCDIILLSLVYLSPVRTSTLRMKKNVYKRCSISLQAKFVPLKNLINSR